MNKVGTQSLLALQIRVIGALVLRETRASFGTTRMGYLWAIVTPVASVGILVLVFSFAGRSAPFGDSFAVFFGTGILTLEFFNKLSNTLMRAFSMNKGLLNYPPIKQTDTLFARLILISATYFLIISIYFSGVIILDLSEFPSSPEMIVQAFLATALLGFGFGIINAVLISIWESWAKIEKILTRPLFFLSGIFYVPSLLPAEAIAFLKWNPVLQLIEWFRIGYYPNYYSPILDRGYPLRVAIILIFLGLTGERIFRHRRN